MNKIGAIENLNKDFVNNLFKETKKIKSEWPALEQVGKKKTVCLLFWEPSTRTKLSFEHAAKALGFNVLDFAPDQSSIVKGESFEDTIKTLLALKVDGFVIRHPEDEISKTIIKMLPDDVFYINAGDGNFAHPTQALLDVFTISENHTDIQNAKITILGDVNHSRVIPSKLELLKMLECSDISFLGPKNLIAQKFAPLYTEINDNCLSERDFLYVLRVQRERFKESDSLDEASFIDNFQVNDNFLNKSGFQGHIMHPGPMNIGVEITSNVASSEKSLVLQQVENGLYLRAALLSLIS